MTYLQMAIDNPLVIETASAEGRSLSKLNIVGQFDNIYIFNSQAFQMPWKKQTLPSKQ